MQRIEFETCRHEWRYYVDLRSKGVRTRRCEHCREERPVVTAVAEVLPLTA